jgi:ABC-2 type transport system permease protein
MIDFLLSTWDLLGRHVRATLRMPIWIVMMIVQPALWLFLFGELFRRVVEIPGFGSGSYIQFLAPGIIVMNALFGSAWSGMGTIRDLNEGVMARLLATPVHRGAIIAARALHTALTTIVQSLIILAMAYALGARLEGGLGGLLALLAAVGLLSGALGGVSNGIALLARKEETLIAAANLGAMPLNFLSSVLMAQALMPAWMRVVAAYNPVNWAADAARAAASASVDWVVVDRDLILLFALGVAATTFATQAFRAYRRAV